MKKSWLEKIVVDDGGCWLWQGSKTPDGYGNARTEPGRTTLVHRYLLEEKLGELLGPYMACHTCDVRACVNPDHCYKGDARSNRQDCMDRGRGNLFNSKKTHCPQGHSYDDAYSYGNGRVCRTCAIERAVKFKQNKRQGEPH